MSTQPVFTYAAEVLSVYDGDTFTADIDLGLHVHIHTAVRLAGCNAFELHHEAGPAARAQLVDLLGSGPLVLSTLKPDKYGGRVDAIVTAGGTDVTVAMIASGYAVAWDGTGPKPVPAWPLP